MKTRDEVIQAAIDAVNSLVMSPALSYEDTRATLIRMQEHVAHLLSHYPKLQGE